MDRLESTTLTNLRCYMLDSYREIADCCSLKNEHCSIPITLQQR